MKLQTAFLIAPFGVWIGLCTGMAKPEEAVEGVSRLASIVDQDTEAFSPAAAFFTLLMLGELDDGETGEGLQGFTRSNDWRSKPLQKGGTVGWQSLGCTWWIDHIDTPSPDGVRVVEHFRGRIIPVDFQDADDVEQSGLKDWVSTGEVRRQKSVLLTEARFRPRWKYAMRSAGKEAFFCDGDPEVEYIQSRVIPVKVWGGAGVKFSLDLEGGGEAAFSTAENGDWSGEAQVVEAIVFIPKVTLQGVLEDGATMNLGGAVDVLGSYGKLLSYGQATLSKWILRSVVDFQEVGGGDWQGKVEKKAPPMVLRIDRPFFYRLTGAHGEVVMQGRVGCNFFGGKR
jgi:hypothetical protein